MAGRIRTIKPELRELAAFAALTDGAARLFLMLYTIADDDGRCPAEPSYLGGAVFFSRPRPPNVVGGLLAEIAAAGLVSLYEVKGARYLAITGWREERSPTHQRISKPQPARYPAPSSTDSALDRGPIPRSREDVPLISDLRPPTTESELPRARAIPGPDPIPTPPRPEPAADRSRQAPDPRVKINHDAWAYAAAKHAELRAEGIDPQAIPFPPMPVGAGAGDLVARTRELTADRPDYEAAMAVHRRRIDVMAAECRRDDVRHLRWFTPSRIWEERPFYKAAELSPIQAGERSRMPTRAADPPTLRLVEEDQAPPRPFGMGRAR